MPDRERKRVPGYWSDILKGSLGSSRVHWQCGNHTEMPNTRSDVPSSVWEHWHSTGPRMPVSEKTDRFRAETDIF